MTKYLLMKVLEKVVSPCDQGQLVDLVDTFTAFLAFTTNPVSEINKRSHFRTIHQRDQWRILLRIVCKYKFRVHETSANAIFSFKKVNAENGVWSQCTEFFVPLSISMKGIVLKIYKRFRTKSLTVKGFKSDIEINKNLSWKIWSRYFDRYISGTGQV